VTDPRDGGFPVWQPGEHSPPPPHGAFGPAAYPFGPAPYAQPPWQPPLPPARKRRRGLAAVLIVVGVLTVGVAVLWVRYPTLLGGTVLNRDAVERDVAAQFREREGVAVRLGCPTRMTLTTGAAYSCTGTTDKGETVRLRITITDAQKATYTWSEP